MRSLKPSQSLPARQRFTIFWRFAYYAASMMPIAAVLPNADVRLRFGEAENIGTPTMEVYPTALERLPDGRLRITWSDGLARVYTIQQLRNACPCAICREKRIAARLKSSPTPEIIEPDELRPLTLLGMKPVGRYAYSLAFSDGHDTGIYTFDLLRELGELVK